MKLSPTHARLISLAAIGAIVALHAALGFGCYKQDVGMFVMGIVYFLLLPLLPAVLSLLRANPLGAVGACLMVAPWMLFAGYVDCIKPYAGGGASLAYVAVVLYGTPGAILGALVTPWLTRELGIVVTEESNESA